MAVFNGNSHTLSMAMTVFKVSMAVQEFSWQFFTLSWRVNLPSNCSPRFSPRVATVATLALRGLEACSFCRRHGAWRCGQMW